ncbi:MAG TPA: hypothetical protein EYO62_01625 [Aquificales bacterium]|nr:hypothetical protein [Aquificales bacterium]HIO41834.1 hypothetical protein [Aquifex sp.]
MGEALKELGKFFYNLALASFIALILQPFAKGALNPLFFEISLILIAVGLTFGFALIVLGETLNQKGGEK